MKSFKKFYSESQNLTEDMTSGGEMSVFSGGVDIGGTGNQFPANNDNGYAPGDYRMPYFMGLYRRPGMDKLKNYRKKRKSSKRHAKSKQAKRK